MSTEHQIHLIGLFNREEEEAASAISPGHVCEQISAGTIQPHSTVGGYAMLRFAEVDALQGNTLEDDYADGDLVALNIELPGNEIQAFLKAGENVAIGDKLISGGDGTLIENGSEGEETVYQIIAVAREALDLSGSGAVDTLMRVQLMP